MPGTYIFKPLEANLANSKCVPTTLNPYCTFEAGTTKAQTQACDKGGKNPHWSDSITLPVASEVSDKVLVTLRDQGQTSSDKEGIGSFTFDLKEVEKTGQVNKWYSLYHQDKYAGKILMEASYKPGEIIKENIGLIQAEVIPVTTEPTAVFMEQRQIVEPRTFVKQVESVELRSRTQVIEVMEPVKVMKEVPVTELVHVKKLVEVSKPEIVTKEIEVMEPRLVTKVIQVVEDVPVKRQVEVVEYRTTIEEVDTMEQQTVMKPIEVTEYVPVKKEVQVTEPVKVNKAVEYVEPVITTETVTKALVQPVIVSQEITQEVGPATLIGMTQEKLEESKLIKEEKTTGNEKVVKEITVTEKTFEKATGAEIKNVSEKVGLVQDKKTGVTKVAFAEHDY